MRLQYNAVMNTKTKRGARALFALCPAAHVLALHSGAGIALFFALRKNAALMRRLSGSLLHPLHLRLAALTAPLPFSLGELLYALAIAGTFVYILAELALLFRKGRRAERLYRLLVRLLALVLGVYALFCLFWGVYYYGADFVEQSGVQARAVSVEELERVTVYFAARLNDFAPCVARDDLGRCRTERAAVLERSPTLMREVSARYPCLAGPEVRAKPMLFSKFMSLIDFTGFFCPFTAEANVNADFPPALFAATVAHELSHQRGVAREDEANFVAVLACLENGDADYGYSACMLAFIHLGNALYSVKPAAYRMVYEGLADTVKADLEENRTYWAQFESPVRAVSTGMYEGFLQSYEQNLGMRSYGACVDYLVSYYAAEAEAHFAIGQIEQKDA